MSQSAEDHHTPLNAETADALARRVRDETLQLMQRPLEPGLYLVATPIGNLGDITLRALSVLARADIIYCEDTRHSAKLLQNFAIRAETRPFHDHNEDGMRGRVVEQLERGCRIALISDAGTPLVSDPGFKLVRECAAKGIPIFSLPGPSALVTALSSSGLPTDAFFFAGFLPPKQAARKARLGNIKAIPATLIFYEAPQRLADLLADMTECLGNRPAVVARELTKMHEELVRGPLRELALEYAGNEPKGEIVVVCGPPEIVEVSDELICEKLAGALQSMRLKDAAAAVSDALGVAKTRVYDLGLKVKKDG